MHAHPTPRKNRTKRHLQQALITLIKEKGFHSVSVKDIVQYAEYNRSTFYIHYQDKFELAEDLLCEMLKGLEQSVGKPYRSIQAVHTDQLNKRSFQIISYVYDNRNFFDLINYQDTIPELHTRFPQTILKIYQEKFEFKTLHNLPVDMNYFTRYTAYGFYGLISNWINTGYETSQEEFIDEVIKLSQTHMASLRYLGVD
ncbi:TetR/AcrR family transcriptional regulator [Oceanobacillus bengalensis]|uniref:TetR/AcrR family transcriptional regulator n=1 Tax=Oceanobacillus bengalensis TaxID=1435466 RepID=A0A494Z8C4_9BACI|nr:TetR/AcrR family transcriptional regulator [Oceanobacillus bengalensis]RKQ18598.1 TetR/AcrR family transcriptional regulator [Oceanobacillus bengalensis]